MNVPEAKVQVSRSEKARCRAPHADQASGPGLSPPVGSPGCECFFSCFDGSPWFTIRRQRYYPPASALSQCLRDSFSWRKQRDGATILCSHSLCGSTRFPQCRLHQYTQGQSRPVHAYLHSRSSCSIPSMWLSFTGTFMES